jgi:hypothetical protein
MRSPPFLNWLLMGAMTLAGAGAVAACVLNPQPLPPLTSETGTGEPGDNVSGENDSGAGSDGGESDAMAVPSDATAEGSMDATTDGETSDGADGASDAPSDADGSDVDAGDAKVD